MQKCILNKNSNIVLNTRSYTEILNYSKSAGIRLGSVPTRRSQPQIPPRTNMENWQRDFSGSFLDMMKARASRQVATLDEAVDRFYSQDEQVKKSFWIDMAATLGTTHKKLHDYFHNTWSKQFCADMAPFKAEISGVLKSCGHSDMKMVLRSVLAHLHDKYPALRFHYQTLYQFINYKMSQDKKFQPAASAPAASEPMSQLVSDQVILQLQQILSSTQ
ncbi:Conserved_hypothetical protein [Hexamita inflata]|uniref:Uncharacterized protein n=1 Tax=Hexamita inflata TaxID=28002 RepID=A0AA86UQI5_9EUKA|nr:Conserved hypothetical protein [Hexamita inflata]